MIDVLVGAGFKVKKCCEVLGVSSAGYYLAKTRPMSPTMIRREWLTGLSREVHADSRGTYGSRRVHAELTKGRGVHVSRVLVTILMHDAKIAGIPGPRKVKRVKGTPTSDDLVQRKFERSSLDELWVTDITEHPTREGKVYCCCVLDTCSRRIVGWSIDSVQDSQLVVNALDMAIKQRRVKRGSVVHADHGVQFTSWSFTERIRDAGLMPSFGSVGDAFDCDDGVVLVEHAERVAQPKEVEDAPRTDQRHLRLHRGVLQSPASPLVARLRLTRRVRTVDEERTDRLISRTNWVTKPSAGQCLRETQAESYQL